MMVYCWFVMVNDNGLLMADSDFKQLIIVNMGCALVDSGGNGKDGCTVIKHEPDEWLDQLINMLNTWFTDSHS